jgi:hypothetical protein
MPIKPEEKAAKKGGSGVMLDPLWRAVSLELQPNGSRCLTWKR